MSVGGIGGPGEPLFPIGEPKPVHDTSLTAPQGSSDEIMIPEEAPYLFGWSDGVGGYDVQKIAEAMEMDPDAAGLAAALLRLPEATLLTLRRGLQEARQEVRGLLDFPLEEIARREYAKRGRQQQDQGASDSSESGSSEEETGTSGEASS